MFHPTRFLVKRMSTIFAWLLSTLLWRLQYFNNHVTVTCNWLVTQMSSFVTIKWPFLHPSFISAHYCCPDILLVSCLLFSHFIYGNKIYSGEDLISILQWVFFITVFIHLLPSAVSVKILHLCSLSEHWLPCWLPVRCSVVAVLIPV